MIKKLVLPDTRRRILCKDFLTKTSPCLVHKAPAIQSHTLIFGQLFSPSDYWGCGEECGAGAAAERGPGWPEGYSSTG